MTDNPVKSLTILIVDDEEKYRQSAKDAVIRASEETCISVEILVANNSVEAIQYFKNHDAVDIVFTDYVMYLDPGADISGSQLCEKLREDHLFSGPVILVTRNGRNGMNINLCREFGLNEILAKPLSYKIVAQIITGEYEYPLDLAPLRSPVRPSVERPNDPSPL